MRGNEIEVVFVVVVVVVVVDDHFIVSQYTWYLQLHT
jgi:hypothetical protein